jgi:hypothetical protein
MYLLFVLLVLCPAVMSVFWGWCCFYIVDGLRVLHTSVAREHGRNK